MVRKPPCNVRMGLATGAVTAAVGVAAWAVTSQKAVDPWRELVAGNGEARLSDLTMEPTGGGEVRG